MTGMNRWHAKTTAFSFRSHVCYQQRSSPTMTGCKHSFASRYCKTVATSDRASLSRICVYYE